ncbi:SH3 domain-containing protein [Melittangium boletus]|uniref:SH3 domain-containing protein n=1 Tax=Melittangium boletus TaxID=83453 RepID=UPI003DA221FC
MREIPDGGAPVGKLGIINWDGETQVRLRSAPNTATTVIRTLPFNSHVQVIKSFAGGWLFVTTPWGDMGFVASTYVWTHLPEPSARLHRVRPGAPGTAIAIAKNYYDSEAEPWGQDLRYYVNVLAHANRVAVPSNTTGWRQVQFKFGDLIWVPGRACAQSLHDVINSGSLSFELVRGLNVSFQRIEQFLEDGRQSILLSRQYLRDALGKRFRQALINSVLAIAELVVGGIALMALATGAGAAIGFFFGGVTAAAGAAIGFEVGLVILEWLGLAMLVGWVAEALHRIGAAFWDFLCTVWKAGGNQGEVDRAARGFAEALADLLGTIMEALAMMAAARGLSATVNALRGTAFGQRFGEGKLGEWLDARIDGFRDGRGGRPREVLARFFRRVELVNGNGPPVGEFDGVSLTEQKFIEYKAARSLSKLNPRTGKPQQTPADWADKQLFGKTKKRISALLDSATRTRAQSSGSRNVPSIQELRGIRRFEFHIDGDTPGLRTAVSAALVKLLQKYPGWSFGARFGVNIFLPPLPDELLLIHGGR